MYQAKRRRVECIEKTCLRCGRKFDVYPSLAKRRFCSRRCGRLNYYGTLPEDENRPRWPSGKLRRSVGAKERKNAKRRAERFKDAARDAVRLAVRRGDLVRGRCETCGAERVEAHHDDYGKPLEVRWLCQKHHREVDLAMGLRVI